MGWIYDVIPFLSVKRCEGYVRVFVGRGELTMM